jgi:cellulose biosynthesis protein BcsQ
VRGLLDAGQIAAKGAQQRFTLEQVHAFQDSIGLRPGRPKELPRGIRIAVENFKGGAGKSSTTLHLAVGMARRGYRVLVVDTDQQATLSRFLGLQPWRLDAKDTIAAQVLPPSYWRTIAYEKAVAEEERAAAQGRPPAEASATGAETPVVDAEGSGSLDLEGGEPLLYRPGMTSAQIRELPDSAFPNPPLLPRPTYISGLDVIPGSMHLSEVEVEVIRRMRDRELEGLDGLFDRVLSQVDHAYDVILMDFQPSFSMSQVLLLWAMDSLVIPVPTETPDFSGTGDFLHQISDFMEPIQSISGAQKVWDPTIVLHTRRKKKSELVTTMAGAVFRNNRPDEFVDDSPAVSSAQAVLKSVYEATANEYDVRAIQTVRQQWDAVLGRVLGAVHERWSLWVQEVTDEQQ